MWLWWINIDSVQLETSLPTLLVSILPWPCVQLCWICVHSLEIAFTRQSGLNDEAAFKISRVLVLTPTLILSIHIEMCVRLVRRGRSVLLWPILEQLSPVASPRDTIQARSLSPESRFHFVGNMFQFLPGINLSAASTSVGKSSDRWSDLLENTKLKFIILSPWSFWTVQSRFFWRWSYILLPRCPRSAPRTVYSTHYSFFVLLLSIPIFLPCMFARLPLKSAERQGILSLYNKVILLRYKHLSYSE